MPRRSLPRASCGSNDLDIIILLLLHIHQLRYGTAEIPKSTGARDSTIAMDVLEMYSDESIDAMAKAVLPQSANIFKGTRGTGSHNGTDEEAV